MQRDPAQPTQMEIRATRVVGQICLGLFIVALVMIFKSLFFQEVSFLGEDGKNLGLCSSHNEARAPKISFRGRVYTTRAGEETAFEQIGGLQASTCFHTYAKLPDGRILIAGKNEDLFDMTDGTWIFDPKSGKKIDGPKMNAKCIRPTLTTLRDGRVLLTGGFQDDNSGPIDTISIFDSPTNRISQIGHLQYPRAEHTCLQINDHEVVVAGGRLNKWTMGPGDYTGSIELLDLNTGKSYPIQTGEKGGEPIVIRDDNKDIYVIGGYYSAKAGWSKRWHSHITRLNIPREDVD